jgi:hypothetical protein
MKILGLIILSVVAVFIVLLFTSVYLRRRYVRRLLSKTHMGPNSQVSMKEHVVAILNPEDPERRHVIE